MFDKEKADFFISHRKVILDAIQWQKEDFLKEEALMFFPAPKFRKIGNTGYWISVGPQTSEAVCDLFENTIFEEKEKIERVLRLGVGNPVQSTHFLPDETAFVDYIYPTEYTKENAVHGTKYFVIMAEQENTTLFSTDEKGENPYRDKVTSDEILVMQKKISATPFISPLKRLRICSIPTQTSGDFINGKDNVILGLLLDCYRHTRADNPLLIHCKTGEMYSGVLLFAFLFLNYFNSLLYEANVESIAAEMRKIFEFIKQCAPNALHDITQITATFQLIESLLVYDLNVGHSHHQGLTSLLSNQQDSCMTTTSQSETSVPPSPQPALPRLYWRSLSDGSQTAGIFNLKTSAIFSGSETTGSSSYHSTPTVGTPPNELAIRELVISGYSRTPSPSLSPSPRELEPDDHLSTPPLSPKK